MEKRTTLFIILISLLIQISELGGLFGKIEYFNFILQIPGEIKFNCYINSVLNKTLPEKCITYVLG